MIGNLLSVPAPGTFCHAVEIGETVSLPTVSALAAAIWAEPVERTNESAGQPAGVNGRPPSAAFLLIRVGTLKTQMDGPQLDDVEGVLPLILKQGVNADIDRVVAVGKVFSQGGARSRRCGPSGRRARARRAPCGSAQFSCGQSLYAGSFPGRLMWRRRSARGAPRQIGASSFVAGWNNQGYGMFVIVDHNMNYITLYAHLSEVEEGEIVAAGQVLGRVRPAIAPVSSAF